MAAPPRGATGAPVVSGQRRAPRHALVGAAVMVVCALGFGLVAFRADPGVPVVVVDRPVAAGQVLTEADVRVVRMATAAGVETVSGGVDEVVGRPAAVPLVPGGVLAPGQVGQAAWPAAGESVVAVEVAAARVPAGLAAGSRVSVLATGSDVGQPAVVPATAVAVESANVAGRRSVSLLLATGDAHRVAAAGDVVLVLETPGR